MNKVIFRDEHRELAELLRERRLRHGLTQADMAPLLSRPQNRVSDFERGSRHIDVIEFIDYCRSLGENPAAIFAELLERLGQPSASAKTKRPRKPGPF